MYKKAAVRLCMGKTSKHGPLAFSPIILWLFTYKLQNKSLVIQLYGNLVSLVFLVSLPTKLNVRICK